MIQITEGSERCNRECSQLATDGIEDSELKKGEAPYRYWKKQRWSVLCSLQKHKFDEYHDFSPVRPELDFTLPESRINMLF